MLLPSRELLFTTSSSPSAPPSLASSCSYALFVAARCYCSRYTLICSLPTRLIINKCIALLQGCCITATEGRLKPIHAFALRHGVHPSNPDFGKHFIFTLVSLSLPMNYASLVFSQLEYPSVFTWNTMIRGHAEGETPESAIGIHRQMLGSEVRPDTHTYPFLLKACARMLDVRRGEAVHGQSLKDGLEALVVVQNTLVHMYSACGQAELAYQLFGEMPTRNLVSWNSVVNGFAQNGRPNEALTLFRQMEMEGMKPDGFTVVSILSACAELGSLALGRRIHVYLLKVGLSENLHVGNALVDLYGKCGNIRDAYQVFVEMPERNVVSWTTMIVSLAVHGFAEEAISLFDDFESERLTPTDITFVGVLCACSHAGLVAEGFGYFEKMKQYKIVPKIEHYGCMVDLLGRAGLVRRAHDFIVEMPVEPNAIVWRTLLGACAIHGQLELGEFARARLLQLEPRHSGDFVLLSNIYANEGRWFDVQRIRSKMLREGVKKSPGHSIVELRNSIHEFIMGDRSHPQTKEIYEMLDEIGKRLELEGYVPQTSNVLADIDVEEKANALAYHSERIAIAFMLINTVAGSTIRVVKNLRVCVDCHTATKLIAKIFDREIVVRDRSRFHHFRDGFCSCKDFW
ncbi:pentatricopeptide repeat-containing protein At4g21065 [Nymphaea colorata]|uniref:pentatricopeptide repeat-containing protein At4g21065 n=1 Tax=Nymphaea colorata TaxID=210225 RepID=UPI00129D60E8|nr:pentatricopeptide repeat-containing protein At4g21065 [Nymphaea colorata]